MHITGQVLVPGDLTGDEVNVWGSPALVSELNRKGPVCDGLVVHLRRGLRDSPAFLAGVYDRSPPAFVLDLTSEAIYVQRTSHLDAIVLRLLATSAGDSRGSWSSGSPSCDARLGAIDTPVLRALGMTRRQIVWSAALPAIIVAAGGAVIAVVDRRRGLFVVPLGRSRIVGPNPGSGRWFAVALGWRPSCSPRS